MDEFMGFAVEWTGDDRQPAIFHGKRSAVYGAIRHRNSEWCYLVDGFNGTTRRIRGNAWVRIPAGTREVTGAR